MSKKQTRPATPRQSKRDDFTPTVTFALSDPFVAEWCAVNWTDRAKLSFLQVLGSCSINVQGVGSVKVTVE